jgi:hypothetical protein
MIGEALGRILHRVLERSGARRAVVSGGDTSGHATRQLGIFALSALVPTIPAAAIFKAHADGPMDGLELALKGGQLGSRDYFGWVRSGGVSKRGASRRAMNSGARAEALETANPTIFVVNDILSISIFVVGFVTHISHTSEPAPMAGSSRKSPISASHKSRLV